MASLVLAVVVRILDVDGHKGQVVLLGLLAGWPNVEGADGGEAEELKGEMHGGFESGVA